MVKPITSESNRAVGEHWCFLYIRDNSLQYETTGEKGNKMSLLVSFENLIKVGEFKSLDTWSETKVVVSC